MAISSFTPHYEHKGHYERDLKTELVWRLYNINTGCDYSNADLLYMGTQGHF